MLEFENELILETHYKILKLVGEGSFSLVYLVRDLQNGNLLALKFPKTNKNNLSFPNSYIEHERKILMRLDHPNIIRLIDSNDKRVLTNAVELRRKNPYLILEFCKYGDFSNFIKKGFPVNIARHYFRQLIQTIEYLHGLNLAHLDIKVSNMVLDYNYNLKLVDFGLSSEIKYESGEEIKIKNKRGTIYNMAPEIISNDTYQGDKVDIFSCGVVLFNLITGKYPFNHATSSDRFYSHILNKDYSNFWNDNKYSYLHSDIKLLINRLLTSDPQERYSIEEIKASDFYNGNLPTHVELSQYFNKHIRRYGELK